MKTIIRILILSLFCSVGALADCGPINVAANINWSAITGLTTCSAQLTTDNGSYTGNVTLNGNRNFLSPGTVTVTVNRNLTINGNLSVTRNAFTTAMTITIAAGKTLTIVGDVYNDDGNVTYNVEAGATLIITGTIHSEDVFDFGEDALFAGTGTISAGAIDYDDGGWGGTADCSGICPNINVTECNATGTVCSNNNSNVCGTNFGGSVSGGQSTCLTSLDPTVLTLSGHTGTILRWESSTDNSNWTGINNIGNTYDPSTITTTTYYRAVVMNTAASNCISNSSSEVVSVGISAPGAITGSTSVCASSSQAYSISAVTGATSYTWSVPTGWSISGGQGTISMTATAGSSGQTGNVTVTATKGSCTTAAGSLTITTVNGIPTANAGSSLSVCAPGAVAVTNASSTNGTIAWTENGAGSITAGATTLSPTYTSLAADAGNTITLTMTVSNATCTAAVSTTSVVANQLAKTITTTGLTTYTSPSNIAPGSTATVECYGGGGGGGNASTANPAAGSGGGGGSYAKSANISITAGTNYSVTVGVGGGAASVGGDSWFNSIGTIFAKGGAAGVSATASGTTAAAARLTTGNTGSTVYYGGKGGDGVSATATGGGGGGASAGPSGVINSDASSDAFGTTAGSATNTGGGNGAPGNGGANANGVAATQVGGGGSGARRTLNNRTGGAGYQGQVIVTVNHSISYLGSPFCASVTSGAVTQYGFTGGVYSFYSSIRGNGNNTVSVNASTGAINPSSYTGTIQGKFVIRYDFGCSFDTVSVIVNPIPSTPTISAGSTTTFCTGGSVTLTSSAGTTYLWSTGATTSSISPTTSGNYTVQVTNASGCQSASSIATTVTVSPTSIGGSVAGSATVCTGTNSTGLTLSGHTGSVMKWQSASDAGFTTALTDIVNTTSNLTATNLSATTYYRAVVTSGVCALANSTTGTVTVNAQPTVTAGGSQTICQNSTATVSGASSANGTILWTHNGFGTLSNTSTLTPTYTASGSDAGNTVTLTMTVSNSPCVAATATYSVVVSPIGVPVTTTISTSGATTYTVPAGATSLKVQTWGAGGGGSKGFSGLKGTGGGGGGFSEKTISVTPGDVLTINVGQGGVGATIAGNGGNGGTTTLTAGATTLTANGGTGGLSTAVPTGVGGAGGTSSGGDVNYQGGYGANLGTPSAAFPGGGAGGSAGTTRDGNGAGDIAPPNAGAGSTGGNAVTGGGAGGGGGLSAGTNGVAGGLPGGGGGGCGGNNGGNGANGQVIITAYVTTITYPGTPFCKTTTSGLPTLVGVVGGTYASTTAGLTINASTGEIDPSTSTVGNYTVTYTSSICGVISTTFVSIVSPVLSMVANSTFCSGNTSNRSIISSMSGTSISWSSSITTTPLSGTVTGMVDQATPIALSASLPNFSQTLANTGTTIGAVTYTFTPTALGCTGPTAQTVLTVSPRPVVTFTASPGSTACAGAALTYTTQSGKTNYVWSVPGTLDVDYTISSGGIGTTDNTVMLLWLTSGNKTVSVNYNNTYSCAASAATSVSTDINFLPSTPTISAGGPTTFCAGGSVTLISSAGSGNQWYLGASPIGGATSTTYLATGSGVYTVTSTVSSCSSAASSGTTVTVNPLSFTWTGISDNVWHNVGNWSCGVIPSSTSDVVISTGTPSIGNSPVAVVRHLDIQNPSVLKIANSGTLQVYGNWTNSGTFTPNSGTVEFLGTSAQSITNSGTENFYNLTVNKASGTLTVNANTNILAANSGTLSVLSGTLDVAASKKMTFKSSAPMGQVDQTARLGRVGGTITATSTFVSERHIGSPSSRLPYVTGTRAVPSITLAPSLKNVLSGDWADNISVTYGSSSSTLSSYSELNGTGVNLQDRINRGWRFILNNNTPLSLGSGYRIFVGLDGSNDLVSVTGNAQTGNYSVPVTYSATGTQGWNLLGNPYPCEINFDDVYAANSAVILPNMYIMDPYNSTNGTTFSNSTYYTYNALTNIAVDPRSTLGTTRTAATGKYIPSSQGFFVNALSSITTGNVFFTESMKPLAPYTDVYGNFRQSEEKQLIRISVSDDGNRDQTVVHFSNEASNGYDELYDAQSFSSGPLNVYTLASNKGLVINGVKPAATGLKIPLVVKSKTFGKKRFIIDENTVSFGKLYIKDKYMGTNTLVSGSTVYEFDITSDTNSSSVGRFTIVGTTGVVTDLGAENSAPSKGKMEIYPNPYTSGDVTISIDARDFNIVDVEIMKADGTVIGNFAGTSDGLALRLDMTKLGLSAGVYLVRCNSRDKFHIERLVVSK